MSESSSSEFVPGLAGVPAAKSSVCYLDGRVGKLQYRGYPVESLAELHLRGGAYRSASCPAGRTEAFSERPQRAA
jgi:citrate synthase